MKGEKVRALLKNTSVKAGAVVLATALVFGSGLWYESSRSGVPELVTFVDTDGSIEISEEEVPLGAPQVTTQTTTKKKTKKIKMKKAAKKTYTKKGKTKTSKKTNKSSNAKEITTTETVTETSVLNKYKKGSKVNTRVTTIKTTVTKTVVSKAEGQVAQQDSQQSGNQGTQQVTDTSITSLASKVDSRVSNAFSTLGFKIVINPNVNYSGLFDARTRTITLKKADDTIYHELGHFVAFMAGNVDTGANFQGVFSREKSKYTAYNKAYVLSNSSEYFAESFKNYTLDPNGLSASRPETYAAIQSAVSALTSAQVSKIGTVYSSIWK